MKTMFEQIIEKNFFKDSEDYFLSLFSRFFGNFLFLEFEEYEEKMNIYTKMENVDSDKETEVINNEIEAFEKKYHQKYKEYRAKIDTFLENKDFIFSELYEKFETAISKNFNGLKEPERFEYQTILNQWFVEYMPENRRERLLVQCFFNSFEINISDFNNLTEKQIEKKYGYTADSFKICYKGFKLLFKNYVQLFDKYSTFLELVSTKLGIDYYSSKQQILIAKYLVFSGVINLEKIHSSNYKQAVLLSALFNRNIDNTHKNWMRNYKTGLRSDFKKEEDIEKVKNLFREVFEKQYIEEIIDEIDRNLKK